MFYAITIKNGIITGVHECVEPITGETFATGLYASHDVQDVPADVADRIQYGLPVASYDDVWTLKPLSQRVVEGLVTVEPGYILDGETIREMSAEEKIAAGLIEEPEQPVIDETAMQIAILKTALDATDYKVIKCYEYSLTGLEAPYDIVQLHAERQAIRDQINALKDGE